MPARLVFLGRLKDVAGTPQLDVAPGPLQRVLVTLDPELAVALLEDRVRVALNGTVLNERGGIVLADGDELAFLPPVSGGQA